MTIRHGAARTALAIALAAPAFWSVPASAATTTMAAPPLARVLSASRLDEPAVSALYRQAVLTGTLPALEAEVAAAAARTGAPAHERAMASLVHALLAWQDGRIDTAASDADAAIALAPGFDAWLLRARLFDATGRTARAAPLYLQAAAAAADPAERAALRLRAAITADETDSAAVAALAVGADVRQRRGIAAWLGVSGKPAEALAIDPVLPGDEARYSTQLRVAQWAIAAGDRARATAASWRAYRAAATPADRRYALALLSEAFRNAHDLPGLLAFLTDKPATPDIVQLRIDTLVEQDRFDDALAVVSASGDPAIRGQLPGLLDLAGRRAALVAEYERLIAREPANLRWYDALATLDLSSGDRAGAIGVFRRLFAANAANAALLTEAGQRMIAMGLTEPALAMVAASGVGRTTANRFFQFESEVTQGHADAAAAVLADLDRSLPPRDPQRIAIADGYDRLDRRADTLHVLTALEAAGLPLGFDQQLRIARLEQGEHRDEAALDRLRRLWLTTALPAQRGFVEAQIVATARRLGRIDAVSDDLRARIAAGDDRGVELLVTLRLARNDVAGAQAAVEQLARIAGSSPARLRRLADLYHRMTDRPRYRATLERLVAVDPANAVSYLQQLVRDSAQCQACGDQAPVSAEALDATLARLVALRRSDPEESRRFTASVYASAGQTPRAIALYRQAVAAAPQDVDAMLGLVNLMNTSGQRAQAIALLQYRAAFAVTPAAQGRAVEALAGLLATTNGGPEPDQSAPYIAARLFWARRLLYWQLAHGDADDAIYDQLADLSEQIGDSRTQRRARDAALATDGARRPAILRELIALASAAGEDTGGAAVGDNAAKAIYGRRLIALRQPYPADTYADLAAAMLAQHDLAGAERAFGLIEEIPGLTNVDALRGDAYLAAGYLPRALAAYSRALLRDSGNRGLILKTAILQEQVGDATIAEALYWQTMQAMLLRRPLEVPVGQTIDPSPFENSVLEGLLFTWPSDPAGRQAIAATLGRMMREALAAQGADGPVPWGRASRARLVLDIARRIAAAGRDSTILSTIDALALARFAGDPAFVRERAAFRDLTGEPAAATGMAAATPGGDWIMRDLRTQASDTGNAELTLALALDTGNDAGIARLFEEAARTEIALRHALGPKDFLYNSPLNSMLTMAAAQLSAGQVRDAVLAPLERAGLRESALFNLYRTAPDRFAALERSAGAPLIDDDRLIALIRTHLNDPTPRRPTLKRPGGKRIDTMATMIARFGPASQVALYAGLVEDGAGTDTSSILVAPLEQAILRRPLSADLAARMTVALTQAMQVSTPPSRLGGRLLSLADVPAANRPIVAAAAKAFAARHPEEQAVPTALDAYWRGDRAAALDILLRRSDSADEEDYARTAIGELLADEYRREGQAFLTQPDPGPAGRARFFRHYVQVSPRTYGGTDADLPAYAERLVALEPDNVAYVTALLAQYWAKGDRPAFTARLAAYVAAHPDERDAASLLQLALLLQGKDAGAAAVARRSRVDVDDPDTLLDLLSRNQAARDGAGGGGLTLLTLFGEVYDAAKAEKPALEGIAAVEARRRQDRTAAVPSDQDPLAPIASVAVPADLPATMRGVWRRSAANPDTPDDGAAPMRQMLLERLAAVAALPPATPQDRAFADALTATPGISAELERETALLAPAVRQLQQPMYDLVTTGSIRHGDAAKRIDALLVRLHDDLITPHELQLLATLALRDGRTLTPAQLADLPRTASRLPAMTAARRIVWSQLYARAGDYEDARQWLSAAAMQILYVGVDDLSAGSRLATFDTIVQALRTWPDKAAAAAAHAALAARIGRERAIMPQEDVPGPLPPLAPAP